MAEPDRPRTFKAELSSLQTPEDLSAALADAGATDAWLSMAPSHRKEHLAYLADAKREATRAKRIDSIVEAALHRKTGSG